MGEDEGASYADYVPKLNDALMGKRATLDRQGRSWVFCFGEEARLVAAIPWRLLWHGRVELAYDEKVSDAAREVNSQLADGLVTGCVVNETGDITILFEHLKLEFFNTSTLGGAVDPWSLTFPWEGQMFVARLNPFGRVNVKPLSDTKDSAGGGRKYRAFISYSHSDLVFARRLHSWLEAFAIDRGGAKPRTFFSKPLKPIYRDEGEITAGSLTVAILDALEGSDSLIVICSDAAADSEWVAQEIHHFRRVRPDGACFAIFSPQSHHGTPLPLPLRQTGEQELYIPNPAEEGELLAFMRLAAGLLSLPLDQVQRHHAEQRGARRRSYEEISNEWGKFGQDQRGRYVRALSKELVDYACEHGVSEYQFGDMLTDAVGVVDDLASALSGRSSERSGNFWPVTIQNHRLREWKVPPADRQELDAAVVRYLGLPIRHEEFDKLLVDPWSRMTLRVSGMTDVFCRARTSTAEQGADT